MADWDNTVASYSASGLYLHFAIGANASRIFWILSENQNEIVDGFPVGSYDSSYDGSAGEYPGPILFTLPSSFAEIGQISGLLVDDSGDSPIFYVCHYKEDGCEINKIADDGTILATRTVDFGLGQMSIEFIGLAPYGVIAKVEATDFDVFTITRVIYDFGFDLAYQSFLVNDEVDFFSAFNITMTAMLTKSGRLWLVGDFGNFSPFYEAIIRDADGSYIMEYPLDAQAGNPISIGIDCQGEDLLYGYEMGT